MHNDEDQHFFIIELFYSNELSIGINSLVSYLPFGNFFVLCSKIYLQLLLPYPLSTKGIKYQVNSFAICFSSLGNTFWKSLHLSALKASTLTFEKNNDSIPLYRFTVIYLTSSLLMDIWLVSSLLLLKTMPKINYLLYMSFCNYNIHL